MALLLSRITRLSWLDMINMLRCCGLQPFAIQCVLLSFVCSSAVADECPQQPGTASYHEVGAAKADQHVKRHRSAPPEKTKNMGRRQHASCAGTVGVMYP